MTAPIHLDVVAGGVGGSWYVLLGWAARLVADVHPEMQIRSSRAAATFDPANASRLARGPLHPGAARYFREAGLLS